LLSRLPSTTSNSTTLPSSSVRNPSPTISV
jgi:hypothetical protein